MKMKKQQMKLWKMDISALGILEEQTQMDLFTLMIYCKNVIVTQNGKNIYPEEIELMLGEIPEISECMVYGKKESEDAHDKELIITAKIIPNYTKIEELHGKNLSDDEIYKIIWDKVKENNKKLTSYKAVKKIEIKKDEFEKTTTMKIKRFAEINKDKAIKQAIYTKIVIRKAEILQ